jgi:hypothetical protein
MGRPYEQWGTPQRLLARIVFLSVRDALNARPHPDSKRQARRKARDLERYGARMLKVSNVTCQSPTRTSKRQEFKKIQLELKIEREQQARKVAARLLGRKHAA